MPFTKLNSGKYKSPSGRIWTKKQVIAYYASNSFRHKRRKVRDALPVDPTNTARISNAFREEFGRRWRKVDKLAREALVDKNAFGFDGMTYDNLDSRYSVAAFNTFIDTVVGQTVVGQWPGKHVNLAYELGVRYALGKLDAGEVIMSTSRRILVDSAISETQGVAAATVQQAVRAFADAAVKRMSAVQAYAAVKDRLAKVGEVRSNMLVDWGVKRAHAEAALDTFSAAGVKQVGVDASGERRHLHVGDARPAEVISRGKRPTLRQRNLIQRREAKLGRLGEVNIHTLVGACQICEDLADQGPYTIDQARGLFPAHAHCRCKFIPVE